MGHPFTLPLLSFLSGSTVPLGAYVHYPVISTDMIGRVGPRRMGGLKEKVKVEVRLVVVRMGRRVGVG
jgi:alpha-1,2-mannosyltransferase